MPRAVTALGAALQSFKSFDYSGGLDVQTSPTKLALQANNTRLSRAFNVLFREDGGIASRTGTDLVCNANTIFNGNGIINGGCQFLKSDGTDQTIIALGAFLYKVTGTTTVTQIKTGLTNPGQNHTFFATYNDTLFIANGVDAPMQYDGTTVTALGGSSPATMHVVVVHGNRLFATATAVPSRLYWSKLNNPTDWSGTTDAGFIDINPNDGGTIKALVSSIQELVILKTNRPYRLQGIGPTTGYTVVDNLVPTTGSVGCQWPTGAVFAGNDVWFVSREGVHALSAVVQFGDLSGAFASRPIRPYFQSASGSAATGSFGTDFDPDMAGWMDGKGGCQLAYNEGNDTLVLATSSLANVSRQCWDRFFIYDRFLKAWSTATLGDGVTGAAGTCIQATSMWPYKDPSTGRHTLYIGCTNRDGADSGGFVVKLTEPDDSGDDSTDATGQSPTSQFFPSVIEHVSCLGAPGVQKVPRHLYLYFRERTGSIDVAIYYDFRSAAAVTATVSTLSTIDTSEDLIIKRLDLYGDCEFMTLRLTNHTDAGPWVFLGYEVQFRESRRVRRAE